MNLFLKAALSSLALSSLAAYPALADVRIAANGQSNYVIVIPAKAPSSIKQAAAELQRSVEEANSVKLPIQTDAQAPANGYISLGATRQAAQSGVSAQKIGDEGFRILTKNNNVYIIGPDTASKVTSSRSYLNYDTFEAEPDVPGPQRTRNGGFSNGTANGVYTFLEKYLDVAWLMPGDIGRDVPRRTTWVLSDIDHTEVPAFIRREFPYLQNTAAVQQWTDRQKLGYSFQINYDHNWLETIPPEMHQTKPEWFAMLGDRRPAPPLSGPRREYSKLESTNPEVIRVFADKAIEYLKANPTQNTFSLSPSDGRNWSESPESKALYDPIPAGSEYPSMTPLVLKFYRDVAEIVGREYPEGKLAGYIYSDYRFVPTKGGMRLPDNFMPVIVLGDGGYRLYRDDTRQEAKELMEGWSKVAPPTWFYYSFGNWLRSSSGLFSPVAADNLNYIFDLQRKTGIKGARIYGTPAWNQAAIGNYVQAKMLWNPELDATTLQREWLHRAYGPAAGATMEQFYNTMEQSFRKFWRDNVSVSPNTSEPFYRVVYGSVYPEMEALLLEAKAKPMTPLQAQRLELMENNLIVLHWRLQNAGYLREGFHTALQRSDAQVVQLLLEQHKDFAYFPDIQGYGPGISPVKVEVGTPPQKSPQIEALPNANSILLYAAKDGEMKLSPRNLKPGSSFLSYAIRDSQSKVVQSGILHHGGDITLNAQAGQPYYFYVEPTSVELFLNATWELFIDNAAPTQAQFQNSTLHLQERAASNMVFVPQALSIMAQPVDNGVLLRPKTTTDERNDAALALYPTAQTSQDLNTDWRFSTDPQEQGLAEGWNTVQFNDSAWKKLDATDVWQNQGFANYYGTTWYRKTFVAPPMPIDQLFVLFFGAIDGDADIYLNGEQMGQHRLGANGQGWDKAFGIDISNALKTGQNTLAVKVTKTNNVGGIYKGASLLMMQDTGTF